MGVVTGLSPFLMACSVLGSLAAWDVSDFSRRLQKAAREDDLRQLKEKHVTRLTLLSGIDVVLILAALILRVRISFGWMFLFALGAILGMLQLVKHLREGN